VHTYPVCLCLRQDARPCKIGSKIKHPSHARSELFSSGEHNRKCRYCAAPLPRRYCAAPLPPPIMMHLLAVPQPSISFSLQISSPAQLHPQCVSYRHRLWVTDAPTRQIQSHCPTIHLPLHAPYQLLCTPAATGLVRYTAVSLLCCTPHKKRS
jgi:hypothetical protein